MRVPRLLAQQSLVLSVARYIFRDRARPDRTRLKPTLNATPIPFYTEGDG